MHPPPSAELAPWPERNWVRTWFAGLDAGRSTTMNKIVSDNGLQTAVYMVCANFWSVASIAPAFSGILLTLFTPDHSLLDDIGMALLGVFGLCSVLAMARWAQATRANRRHRAAGRRRTDTEPPTPP